jgi:hypothetical protein
MTRKQELIQPPEDLLQDIQHSKNLAEALIRTKHYQQLGTEGIFAVIQKAKVVERSSYGSSQWRPLLRPRTC